jgi:hypothetical protein
MSLESFLRQKRAVIVKKWFERIADAYPANTAAFLRRESNQFANPVGNSLSEGTAALFDALLDGADADKVFGILDRIIRIRAVQEFAPSQAVSFIFVLKGVIRDELGQEAGQEAFGRELTMIESRIDEFSLLAFDAYNQCREQIYGLKLKELRGRGIISRPIVKPTCDTCETDGGRETEACLTCGSALASQENLVASQDTIGGNGK